MQFKYGCVGEITSDDNAFELNCYIKTEGLK